MNDKGIILVVSGPSGSGKGTVIAKLMEENSNLRFSVSATTRAPRPGEEEGRHYLFRSREAFEAEIENGGMLEYASYCGNYYGTPRQPVFALRDSGRDVILDIEVQGALQVMEQCPEAVTVFLAPPSLEELRRRLTGRATETDDAIRRRLCTAEEELKLAGKYDYQVVNHTVEQAAADLLAIIRAERLRTMRK